MSKVKQYCEERELLYFACKLEYYVVFNNTYIFLPNFCKPKMNKLRIMMRTFPNFQIDFG